jgi:FAD/FMN-containing dehydrogenase
MDDKNLTKFVEAFRGQVIGLDHPEYEEARRLYNGMIDKRPRLIARCADVADVITAVNFGRDKGLPIAIRGGGHNGPGFGSVDEGMVIDLSKMRSIRVDQAARTVRVEPGCTSGDVDHATNTFGLAVPFGIVSTTGVAGLTLGGGTGYLTRKHGLTIDNLLEADVVLADGTFVTASKKDNSDLFWALRGGGGNFGVVTSFLFQAHAVSMVFAGPIFWDAKHGVEIMRSYAEFLRNAPEGARCLRRPKGCAFDGPVPSEAWGKRACAMSYVGKWVMTV